MDFPDKLKIKLNEKNTMKPISSILFFIKLKAKNKNNYFIGPFLTDIFGEVIIDKEYVNKQIDESKDLFVMDYTSNLEECEVEIEICIFSGENLKQRIQKANKYFPKDAKHLEGLYEESINDKFSMDIIKVLEINDEIILEI